MGLAHERRDIRETALIIAPDSILVFIEGSGFRVAVGRAGPEGVRGRLGQVRQALPIGVRGGGSFRPVQHYLGFPGLIAAQPGVEVEAFLVAVQLRSHPLEKSVEVAFYGVAGAVAQGQDVFFKPAGVNGRDAAMGQFVLFQEGQVGVEIAFQARIIALKFGQGDVAVTGDRETPDPAHAYCGG